jgi:predicted dinucleotide-binding enzyme
MHIGIVGSDDRGLAIGRLLRRGGHHVSFSDPRGPNHARHAAQALGEDTVSTTSEEQARFCDAIVLAVRWQDLPRTLDDLALFENGVLIDAVRAPAFESGKSGAELLAEKFHKVRVAKAFVEAPLSDGVVQFCADDGDARELVTGLILSSGAQVDDLGPLRNARALEHDFAEKPGIETEGISSV